MALSIIENLNHAFARPSAIRGLETREVSEELKRLRFFVLIFLITCLLGFAITLHAHCDIYRILKEHQKTETDTKEDGEPSEKEEAQDDFIVADRKAEPGTDCENLINVSDLGVPEKKDEKFYNLVYVAETKVESLPRATSTMRRDMATDEGLASFRNTEPTYHAAEFFLKNSERLTPAEKPEFDPDLARVLGEIEALDACLN